jgi:flagellar biosynthesis protein FlhA
MEVLINKVVSFFSRNQDLMFVAAILSIMFTIFIPLPLFLLDFLLIISITMSVIVILTVVYVAEPVKFSVFPSVLLLTTTFRLALNVATTRQILGNAGQDGTAAAGSVVQAFGNFVAGAEPVIGFIIFIILIVVNFIVIAKGATRISEVAARFTLDAMPGKQMAIDADLNSGVIKESEAKGRREAISREADFYGAMDGATKFVRGDAIAGIIITIVNVVGGFLIGAMKYDMTLSESLYTFSILTIGDGLVSQIPALIVSLSAGLIVTRATAEADLGKDFLGQMLGNRKSLGVTIFFLGVLGMTAIVMKSGLPWFQILVIMGLLGALSFVIKRTKQKEVRDDALQRQREDVSKKQPENVEGLLQVDPMELEIGYGLIRMVDPAQGGLLLERVTRIRRQMAVDMGMVIPPIRIRDNMQLEPNHYVVKIRGITIAEGDIVPDMFMAMDAGAVTGTIEGTPTREPAFGMDAIWISEAQKQRAESLGYLVVDGTTVLTQHLTELIRQHSAELLTREDVNNLIKTLKESNPAVVEEVVPGIMKPGEVQKVLQNLLLEGISIRDLATILETLGDFAPKTKDPEVLTEYVRNSLARTICQQYREKDGKIYVVTLDPKLEDLIKSGLDRSGGESVMTLSPVKLKEIGEALQAKIESVLGTGHSPVLLCSPQTRLQVKRIVETVQPGTPVISYNEIVKDLQVESLGMVAVE